MVAFQVVVECHQLANQKGSSLLVSTRKEAIVIMKYANHKRICSELMSFFGNVRVLDGGVDEYTAVAKTGDHTGTVWSIPNFPCLRGIEDIADSILACHEKKVRAAECTVSCCSCFWPVVNKCWSNSLSMLPCDVH
jgi:hypothetical protein